MSCLHATGEVRLFRGVQRVQAIDPGNRGLAYGDGVFETMRAFNGGIPWWDRHWARLQDGCHVLGIAPPLESMVRDEAREMLLHHRDAVLKLIVTRSSGGRGYAPPVDAVTEWQLSLHPLPQSKSRLELIWCQQPLSLQPVFAGIKHCNRLEQVMARREVEATGADDGLLCGMNGHVIGATAANVFVLDAAGDWVTPSLHQAGVAGVCRGWVLGRPKVRVAEITRQQLAQADAVFVCNAVRGILPVWRLGGRTWPLHPALSALQAALGLAHPAFATVTEN